MNADESLGAKVFHPGKRVPARVTRLDREPDGDVMLQLAHQTRENPKDRYGWTLEPYRMPGSAEMTVIDSGCGTCFGTGWYPEPERGYKRPCAACLNEERAEPPA